MFLTPKRPFYFHLIFRFDQFIHGEHSMLLKNRPFAMSGKTLSTKVFLTCSTPTDSWRFELARVTWHLVWSTLYRQHFKHISNEMVSCHFFNLLSFFQFKLCSTIRTIEHFNHFSRCLFSLAFHELLQATFAEGVKAWKCSWIL